MVVIQKRLKSNTQVDSLVNVVVMALDDNKMVMSTPADAMIPSTPVDTSQAYDVTLTPVTSMQTPQRQVVEPSNTHLANIHKRRRVQDNYHDLVAEERVKVKLESSIVCGYRGMLGAADRSCTPKDTFI